MQAKSWVLPFNMRSKIQNYPYLTFNVGTSDQNFVFKRIDCTREKKSDLRVHFQFWTFDTQANFKYQTFDTSEQLWNTLLFDTSSQILNLQLTLNILKFSIFDTAGQTLNFQYLP